MLLEAGLQKWMILHLNPATGSHHVTCSDMVFNIFTIFQMVIKTQMAVGIYSNEVDVIKRYLSFSRRYGLKTPNKCVNFSYLKTVTTAFSNSPLMSLRNLFDITLKLSEYVFKAKAQSLVLEPFGYFVT